MKSPQGELFGHLKVSCCSSESQILLPLLFAEFIMRHPMVTSTCQPRPRKAISSDLFEGLVHLALGRQEDFSPSREMFPLLSDPVYLIVPLSHPWCDNGTIQPNDLSGTSVILCQQDSNVMNVVKKELATIGVRLNKLKTTLTPVTPEAVTIAVAQGLGIGFVP